MRRIAYAAVAHRQRALMLIVMVFLVPVALAADAMPHSGRVLISTQGDVTIPAASRPISSWSSMARRRSQARSTASSSSTDRRT